jgi:hypothetical protein
VKSVVQHTGVEKNFLYEGVVQHEVKIIGQKFEFLNFGKSAFFTSQLLPVSQHSGTEKILFV